MSAVAAIGIDFGTDTIVIGAARKGGVDILDNEVSNRLTPNFIGFGEKVRSIGESGLNEFSRNPKNTVTQLNRFLGRSFDDPGQDAERSKVAFRCEKGERGEVLAAVTLGGEERKFSMESCMCMMLGKLKFIIENHVGPIKDVVVCIPGYYTAFQRQAVLDAGSLAGLNIVQVMNEHAAQGLAYGITKTDLTAESRKIMVVDWGHANLSCSVQSFVKGKLEVLSTAFDCGVGGRDLDNLIVDYFVKEFQAKNKVNLYEKPRALVKLTAQCQKVKKSLSMNPVAQISMECLYEDFDLRSKIERDTLNELAQSLYERIIPCVEKCLADSGCTKEELHGVEMVGNSIRVPSFKDALQAWLGKECSTTLSASDCVAKGSCLQAAILSPAFRVRDFKVVDKSLYPITLVWQPYEATAEQVEAAGADPENVYDVFQKNNVLPSVKMLTFERLEPFQLVAFYKEPEMLPPGTPACLGTWKVGAIPPPGEGKLTSRKIKVKARLTLHGTLEVDTAQVWDEFEPEPEPEAEPEPPPEVAAAEPEPPAAEPEGEAAAEPEGEAKPMDTEPPKVEPPKEKKPPKPKVVKSELPMVSLGTPGLAPDQLEKMLAGEKAMMAADDLAAQTDKAMNDLEAYILEKGRMLDDAWKDFLTEADKSAFRQKLEDAQNWFYDHWDEPLEKYVEQLDLLTAVGDPVAFLVSEAQARPDAIAATRSVLEATQADAASGPEVEKFAHIEQAERDKVLAECQRVTATLDESLAKLDAQPKSDKPCMTTGEIRRLGEDLKNFARPIMNKPKPAPKVEKKEEPAKPEGEAAAEPEGEAPPPVDPADPPPVDAAAEEKPMETDDAAADLD